MIRRLGVIAEVTAVLCVYSSLLWFFSDDIYPNPEWMSGPDRHHRVMTTEGETYYRKDDEYFHPGGGALTDSETVRVRENLLNQTWYPRNSFSHAEKLYGYRWREASQKIYSSPGRIKTMCFPLVDEGTYALYSGDGIMLGRFGPDGFVNSDGPIKGFQSNAASTAMNDAGGNFAILDTTGLYRIFIDPPVVRRLFVAPSTTRNFTILMPSGGTIVHSNIVDLEAQPTLLEWIADTELFIGNTDNIIRLELPPSLRKPGDYVSIWTSKSMDKLALNYSENESDRARIIDMHNGSVIIDTAVPEFAARIPLSDPLYWQIEAERRAIFLAAIQPVPIPIIAVTAIAIMRDDSTRFDLEHAVHRHAFVLFSSGLTALLALHFTGALAGYLLARCAGLRSHAACFWTLAGFLVSIPIILIFPLYAPRRKGIPCPSCGRNMDDPRNCAKCGPVAWPEPLMGREDSHIYS